MVCGEHLRIMNDMTDNSPAHAGQTRAAETPAKASGSTWRDWSAHLARMLLAIGAVACVVLPVAPAEGLLAGACIVLLLGNPVAKLTHRWSGLILKVGVVLLGAEMNLGVVWRVGAGGVGYTMPGIALAMAAGWWLGRRFGLERDAALLISTGTAICGGSAIAAMSAAIKPKAHDVAVAMAAVFLLNALGLLIFPLIGRGLGFSQEQFGMWAALAIHDTSSVVGAAMAYGTAALGIAVTVKLTRALWIVPLTAWAGWRYEKKARAAQMARAGAAAHPKMAAWRRFMPQPFIIGYLLMAAVFTYAPARAPALGGVFASVAPWCGFGAHRLMTLALFLIGAGLSREALRQTGVRPLKMAFALWCVVSVVTAAALWAGWIVAPRV